MVALSTLKVARPPVASPAVEFTVLSHAGLSVTAKGTTLVTDPWLVGSTYWRAWWNYPPVAPELVDSVHPDFVYLTHNHWDHFQGVSLRRFPLDTPILVPRGHHQRMRRDLVAMGFTDVRELRHARTVTLAPGYTITSYHSGPFLDSMLVIEADGVTVFNATDSKPMGLPLRQVLDRHPHIDFVLKSHSSANSRLCYEVVDDPGMPVDDEARYIAGFADFAVRVGADHAIPFASNHCFLHKDVFAFNDTVKTPRMVQQHFEDRAITSPHLQIMVSGDSWSSDDGFHIADQDWFDDRPTHLEAYRASVQDKLDAFYRTEADTVITVDDLRAYFDRFARAVPWPVRRWFKGHPIVYVLAAGDRRWVFEVDLYRRSVRELDEATDEHHPIQIHTGAYVMLRCMDSDLFSHLAISKRVRYRVTVASRRYVQALNLAFNLYEYDYLPLRKVLTVRQLTNWAVRWRELALYLRIAVDVARGRGLDPARY